MRLIDSVRSVIAALRASRALGRAYRAQRQERFGDALAIAHVGLEILRGSYVRRTNPPEGAALASLTILAEEVASQLEKPGASAQDIADSLRFLRGIDASPRPELCLYIPFLEKRLATSPDQPAA
jgi:hypothetical protein